MASKDCDNVDIQYHPSCRLSIFSLGVSCRSKVEYTALCEMLKLKRRRKNTTRKKKESRSAESCFGAVPAILINVSRSSGIFSDKECMEPRPKRNLVRSSINQGDVARVRHVRKGVCRDAVVVVVELCPNQSYVCGAGR